jgi:hypothetical protein
VAQEMLATRLLEMPSAPQCRNFLLNEHETLRNPSLLAKSISA